MQSGMTLMESERKQNKAKENDLINDVNDETNNGQVGQEYYGDEPNANCGKQLMTKLWICVEIDECNLRTTDATKCQNAKMLTELIKSSLWWVTTRVNTRDFD